MCLRGCARGNICSLACMCVNVRDNVHARSCGAYGYVCVCASMHACVLMHVIVSIMLVSMSLQISSIN